MQQQPAAGAAAAGPALPAQQAGGVPPQQPQQQNPAAPQQPQQPQQQAANMLGAPIGHTTYAQYYDDPTKETWQGVLADIYQQIDVDAGVTPQALRTLFYEAGNNRDAVCILVHVRAPNANADDPGTIRLVHRLTRFVHVQALVRQRPFPNLGHGFLGDVRRNGQAPASVEIPDNLFNRINVNTQVPDHGLLDQELNADPNLQLAGPYPAGTADTSPVDSRQAIMVPNFIARMFLHQGMKPRDAYQAIYGAVQAAGMMGDCDPLLNWIRLALTRPAAGQPPRTAIAPLTPPVIATQEGQDLFLDYRLEHLHYDLPGLAPGAMLALGQIAHQGFASLTQEQHLTRLEAAAARQEKTARKKPSSYYLNDLDTLLRLAQVASEDDLPEVHEKLANHSKGQPQRLILERAIRESLVARRLKAEFPVTTAMAQKVQTVSYSTPTDGDLSLGLTIFNMGALNSVGVKAQDQANRHADTIYGNSVSPSLDDVAQLTDASKDVVIPRTVSQLRTALNRTLVFYETLFGQQHPLVQATSVARDLR
eukprot:scaffold22568_cov125-Cylindrotheca_fusiformis.AAC.1